MEVGNVTLDMVREENQLVCIVLLGGRQTCDDLSDDDDDDDDAVKLHTGTAAKTGRDQVEKRPRTKEVISGSRWRWRRCFINRCALYAGQYRYHS